MEPPKRRRIWMKRPPLPHEEDLPVMPEAPPPAAAAPAPRGRQRQTFCPGKLPGQPCCFAADGSGQAARGKREGHCSFCHKGNLDAALDGANGRKIVVRLLKQWRQTAPEIFRAAFERGALTELDADARASLRAACGDPTWEELLAKRRSVAADPTPEQLREFEAGVEQDRAYVQKKFFPTRARTVRHANYQWRAPMSEALRGQVHDLASNDAGLPTAAVSPTAKALEAWCKRGSWDLCRQCASVQPRHLKEAATRTVALGSSVLCKNCTKKPEKQTWVPSPEDVPAALRGLSRAQVEALRPLDVDSGPEWRAEFGYFFHSSMIRFSWAADDVEDKIKTLPTRRERKGAKKARACASVCVLSFAWRVSLVARAPALTPVSLACQAFKFLVDSDDCNYCEWIERHRRFLNANPQATSERRKRPLRYIEEEGIETAVWPHLYWTTWLCETAARLADVRRQRRQGLQDSTLDDPMGEEEAAPGETEGRQSLKRRFLLKALGPIADYAGDFNLLHFVFDLSTWSDIGGKKGALRGMPMWQAMKGAAWTP